MWTTTTTSQNSGACNGGPTSSIFCLSAVGFFRFGVARSFPRNLTGADESSTFPATLPFFPSSRAGRFFSEGALCPPVSVARSDDEMCTFPPLPALPFFFEGWLNILSTRSPRLSEGGG